MKIWKPTLIWSLLFWATIPIAYQTIFWNRFYPNVQVAGISLGGKTQVQALELLKKVEGPKVTLISENPKVEIPLEKLKIHYDTEKTIQEAFTVGRTGNLKTKSLQKLKALSEKINIPLSFTTEGDIGRYIAQAEESINIPPTEPTISVENNEAIVNKGKDGAETDKELLIKSINKNIAFVKSEPIVIPIKITKAELSDQEAELIRERAQKLIKKAIKVTFEYQALSYNTNDLIALLAPEGFKEERVGVVVADIAKSVNRPPQDARLVFEEGKVREFTPGKDGVETIQNELKTAFKAGIENLIVTDEQSQKIEVPAKRTKPQVATGDVNTLGIKELIGRGTSRFAGSIASRIHNIELAASRINGLLIKPGENFSFNDALGDVSAYTGYQQAYVIQGGKTVLGDGGGVCQVSSTLFRAGLNAGLPLLERRAHSYRVGYYEQDSKPGLDATVYSGTADLKIKNDTLGHILIQSIFNRKTATLVFELYGTSDGRVATITTPRIWDVVPAPPPLYQEDPSIAPGTKKQIDYAASGAKAAFDYKVTKNGEVLQNRTFYSNYRPWQAIYLVAPGTPTQ
ncbi:MAG: hypothetical protein A2700_01820 [Candidatus Blackburnbacteria bacterium RIFCSPHIGHO2_01_FULL_44_64]|uniref:YoaR-like putative peptidoglycan binding domain-containing protein n=1 Tax=Candidatus Blackburnbacteria bacterium RIFCSPHIGHO2_02_FULL_44_20 TaxID=1797516 RepID=A0A1G1V582_9BACT|nr:MAG: hypothetical protein A2700_01820 [Candidatus Blackburnbacteria bacterium RIFCSPHIGHO2_01_FULL_44_64]OGY10516.1 MAG: hypothetical protein A3D26_00250 [Candidatus Blackburnbacteria bacterium RIFCSPHIGHO2_02_FULL_44_20]OGY12258.1 MAG: hypothetical protein A3E16_01935 [Candidatus Blackburnbacteria bacterium RIFCSPHIGHO2_12_FULL_44_25]OGY14873.1 MAG: hypothetical protein A3A62_00740 [Candidatus Blackburnbacteria bacterium RIFCSPLOWO2_01_FULL_44_43]